MTRLEHVKGMIDKIDALSRELWVRFDRPVPVPFGFGYEMRFQFDNRPRSLKARDAQELKHKRHKRLLKELFIKHGQFMKDNKLTPPTLEGRMTVLK